VAEVYAALVLGTRDYVRKSGFQKVLIGLSGGVDSSLVAAIAVEALGKENVVGISMPSQFSSQGTMSDAKRVAQNLGIRYIEFPIQGLFNKYLSLFKKEFAGHKFNVAEENLQGAPHPFHQKEARTRRLRVFRPHDPERLLRFSPRLISVQRLRQIHRQKVFEIGGRLQVWK